MKKFICLILVLAILLQLSTVALGMGLGGEPCELEVSQITFDDEVSRYIVKLSKAPVYEYSENSGKIAKNSISARFSEVKSQQKNVEKVLTQSFSGIEILYKYDQVFNGFSIEAGSEQIEEIKKLPDVLGVYKVKTHQIDNEQGQKAPAPKAQEQLGEDLNIADMYADIKGNSHGEGSIIAIIDAAFDANHEAFQLTDVSKAKLKSKNEVADFIDKDLTLDGITVNQVYKSVKIPFAYDYADKDGDVYFKDEDHGTHVSGIASGNGGEIKGLSPESQLVLMKVQKDSESGARDDVLIAALNDAVEMGVDCINLSMGSSYFNGAKTGPLYETIENIKATKTQFFVSAGNDSFGYKGKGSAYTSEVAYAASGTPRGYSGAMAVGNAFGYNSTNDGYKMYDNLGYEYLYKQEGNSNFTKDLMGVHEFVIAGYGTEEELKAVGVEGKIVVVLSGTADGSTYTSVEKTKVIKSLGGIGMIMCVGLFNTLYDTEGFPAAIIHDDEYKRLEALGSGTLTITDEPISTTNPQDMNPDSSYVINEYLDSSVGISGPGTFVRSSINDDEYKKYSGTSMAAPAICGAYAIAKTWFEEKFPEYVSKFKNPSDLKTKVFTMMQNTADPIESPDTHDVYTPRVQGAGYANLKDMISSKVIASNPKTGEGMQFSGSVSENSFIFEVRLENLSGSAVTYDKLTAMSIVDKVEDDMIVGTKNFDAKIELPSSVTIPANSEKNISVKVSLTPEQRKALDDIFENGFFLDGFLHLNSTDKSLAEITYPFTSFIGDFTKAPLLDDGYYEETDLFSGTRILSYKDETGGYYSGGFNILSGELNKNKIYLSADSALTQSGYLPCFLAYCIRPVDLLEFYVDSEKISEAEDNKAYSAVVCRLSKVVNKLSEGKHVFSVKATNLNGQTQTISYDVYIDNTYPSFVSAELQDNKLTLMVEENEDFTYLYTESGENYKYATLTKGEGNSFTAVIDEFPERDGDEPYYTYMMDLAFNGMYFCYNPDQELSLTDNGFEKTQRGTTFKYTVENTCLTPQSFVSLMAIYDENGKMTDVYKEDEVTLGIGEYVDIEADFKTDFKPGYKRKIFVFNSLTDLLPRLPVTEFEYEDKKDN